MRIRTQFSIFFTLLALLASAVAGADAPTTMMTTTMPMTGPTTGPTTAPLAITWDQAKDHIGDNVTVTGPVIGTHDFGGAAVLNIGKDFPDAGRFTVYLSADNRKGLPDNLDKGKTIAVTGTLKLFHKVPEIEGDPAHITVLETAVEPGPTTAATQP